MKTEVLSALSGCAMFLCGTSFMSNADKMAASVEWPSAIFFIVGFALVVVGLTMFVLGALRTP